MWQGLNLSEVKQKLRTNYQYGLTMDEVEKRFHEYGENKLADKPRESLIVKFFKQFNDFMIIILIITINLMGTGQFGSEKNLAYFD